MNLSDEQKRPMNFARLLQPVEKDRLASNLAMGVALMVSFFPTLIGFVGAGFFGYGIFQVAFLSTMPAVILAFFFRLAGCSFLVLISTTVVAGALQDRFDKLLPLSVVCVTLICIYAAPASRQLIRAK